ncbi:MAG: hypothetical protein RIS64_4590 [Bacteroidota bacterium]|jgi:hypothetical protein
MIIYPNPTVNRFTIHLKTEVGTIESIEIYNAAGKWIQEVSAATNEVNIEQQPAGIYICRVKTNKGDVLTGKIIKQ